MSFGVSVSADVRSIERRQRAERRMSKRQPVPVRIFPNFSGAVQEQNKSIGRGDQHGER